MVYGCRGNEKINFPPSSGIGAAISRDDGDRLCETRVDIYPGRERCEEVYRIGNKLYEQLHGTKKGFTLKQRITAGCRSIRKAFDITVKSLYRKELWFEVPTRGAFINITSKVQQSIDQSGVKEGLELVNPRHY